MNVKPYLLASASVLLMAAYGTAHAQTTDTTAQTTTFYYRPGSAFLL